MNQKLWKLLNYHLMSDVVMGFIFLFMNLYIWEKEKSIVDLAWYNLIQFLTWMIIFPIGINILHKTSMRVVLQLANICVLLLFSFLLLIETENQMLWLWIVGGFTGLVRGFSSAGKNMGVASFGEKEGEYEKYFQYLTLYSRMVQILSPIMFAYLLIQFDYKGVFVCLCLYSLVLIVHTFFIPNEKNENNEPLFQRMFSPFVTKKIKLLLFSFLLGGMFSEFQTIILHVFTFSITEDKWGVAILNIVYSILMIGLMQINKMYKNINGVYWLYIGATIGFIGFGLTMFLKDWWLILANLLIVAGNFYFLTIYYSQHFEAMNDLNEIDKKRMLIWREIFILVSRIILLIGIILLGKMDEKIMVYLFGIVICMTFFVPLIHQKILVKK